MADRLADTNVTPAGRVMVWPVLAEGSAPSVEMPLVALAVIEVSDIIFAVDSVPAIFALTKEPMIVFTSNVFAILGLRAMYFLLAGEVRLNRRLVLLSPKELALLAYLLVAEVTEIGVDFENLGLLGGLQAPAQRHGQQRTTRDPGNRSAGPPAG